MVSCWVWLVSGGFGLWLFSVNSSDFLFVSGGLFGLLFSLRCRFVLCSRLRLCCCFCGFLFVACCGLYAVGLVAVNSVGHLIL